MDAVMLTVKRVLCWAMELFVIAVSASALIMGLYWVVKDKVREDSDDS